jgi:hypothetical protein
MEDQVITECADCDTYALAATILRRTPKRYEFRLEMLSALVLGWWLMWQAALPR